MKAKYIVLGTLLSVALSSCEKDDKITLPAPENKAAVEGDIQLYNKANPSGSETEIYQNGVFNFVAKTSEKVTEGGTLALNEIELSKVVANYNTFKGTKDYTLLPQANYTFEGNSYAAGATEAEAKITIKNYNALTQGDYMLPLKVKMGTKEGFHIIKVHRDADYVALSSTSKKPLPPDSYNCPNRTEPMKMVAYVETNDWDIRNMGQFVLENSKKPIFDIVIAFAPNMNYDVKQGKRVLHFNDKLQPIVKDPNKYIKPLKDRGIKVLMTILPNHQGVGYFNFQNYQEAVDFAKECKTYADKLGIDGFDIDEEYADYHNLPEKPTVGNKSFLWFMRAMKEVMPDKLLTLYDYNHNLSSDDVDEWGKSAKDYLDYSWANYFENHGSYAGLPNEKYGMYSIEANWGLNSSDWSAYYNLEGCYGLMMVFNIKGGDIKSGSAATQLSKATERLYGENCVFQGKYHKGPKD